MEAVAGQLCNAAKRAGDAAAARLQPLHTMHEGDPAGGPGGDTEAPPADAAAALASIVQALQLTFSDLLGPLRAAPSVPPPASAPQVALPCRRVADSERLHACRRAEPCGLVGVYLVVTR